MIILRLFVLLAGLAVGLSVVTFVVTRDRRYLRFAWQLFKFSIVLLLVFGALIMMGRIILY